MQNRVQPMLDGMKLGGCLGLSTALAFLRFADATYDPDQYWSDLIFILQCVFGFALLGVIGKIPYRSGMQVGYGDAHYLGIDYDDYQPFFDEEQEHERPKPAAPLVIPDNPHEIALHDANVTKPVPNNYKDPIFYTIMFNPVMLVPADKNEYDQGDIVDLTTYEWLVSTNNQRIPQTRAPFNGYVPVRNLRDAIADWVKEAVTEKRNETMTAIHKHKRYMHDSYLMFQLKDKIKNNPPPVQSLIQKINRK